MPTSQTIAIPEREQTAVEATIQSVVAPGATLGGEQRRELAQVVRQTMDGAEAAVSSPVDKLTRRLTNDAHTFRSGDVAHTVDDGIGPATYVEILSLVARVSAVDTLHFGLGLDPAPLPDPIPGPPSGLIADEARVDQGWVPTVGPASPPNALSLLPQDDRAMHELHGALYLSIPEMADTDIKRGLHRSQMELVAARTSLLNECFF